MLTLEQLDEIVRANVPDSFGCAEGMDEDEYDVLFIFENGMVRVNPLDGDFALIPND